MRFLALALALIAGCVLSPYSTSATHATTTDATPTDATSGTGSAGTTSAAATDSTTTTTTTTTTSSTGDTTCSFLDCAPDTSGSSPIECDLWKQNCPEGQKCMPWANERDFEWNATKCTNIMPNPGKPGDSCTAEGNGVSGVDSCEKAAMCWDISQDTGMGTCVGLCMGSQEAPTCPSGLDCTIGAEGTLIICLPGCDPVQQDCPNMDLCIPQPMGDGFVCVLDNSGDGGQLNDPCASPDACDPGLSCLPPAFAAECDPMAPGCCLPFCDLDLPACTNKGATCVPWYEPGMALPLLDHVGICRLP